MSLFMMCLTSLRNKNLQDASVDCHTEESVLTLHTETITSPSGSASTIQPLPQSVLLLPGRPCSQRIQHNNLICGTNTKTAMKRHLIHYKPLHSAWKYSTQSYKAHRRQQKNIHLLHTVMKMRNKNKSWPVPPSARWTTKRLARSASVYEVTLV